MRFSGIYLPLLWEPSFCSRSPISLGYTRGHFCALVPPEPTSLAAAMAAAVYSGGAASFGATSVLQSSSDVKSTYLPLTTYVYMIRIEPDNTVALDNVSYISVYNF